MSPSGWGKYRVVGMKYGNVTVSPLSRVDQVVSEVNDLKRIFEVFKHHRQNAVSDLCTQYHMWSKYVSLAEQSNSGSLEIRTPQ